METGCIFCSLGKGNPYVIFEDELCYVVPDRFPTEYGHLLVISKEHTESMLTAPDGLVTEMFLTAKRLGLKLRDKLGSKATVIATNAGREAGQVIFHFHIHVVPKYEASIRGFVGHKEQDAKEVERLVGLLKS